MNASLHDWIVMIWVFSSVLTWPFTPLFIFDGLFSRRGFGYLKVMRPIGIALALISLLSFGFVGPEILHGLVNTDLSDNFVFSAVLSLYVWLSFHMGV